jgi:hypothetical protein
MPLMVNSRLTALQRAFNNGFERERSMSSTEEPLGYELKTARVHS